MSPTRTRRPTGGRSCSCGNSTRDRGCHRSWESWRPRARTPDKSRARQVRHSHVLGGPLTVELLPLPLSRSLGLGAIRFLIDANSGAIRRIAVPKDGFGISSVAWSGRGDEFVYSVAESVAGGFGNSGSPGWIMAQNARTGVSRRIFWGPYGASVFAIAGTVGAV